MSHTDIVRRIRASELFCEQIYLAGQWQDSEQTIAVDNPATGEIIGHVPVCSDAQLAQAFESAESAFKQWRDYTAEERGRYLYAFFELMQTHEQTLAEIMTLEQGKPLAESIGEIRYAASFVKWFAEEARRAYGRVIPAAQPGEQIIVKREPIGVTAAITPWNFPSSMITRKAAAALAAGCSMVVKPASATPFSALALAKLAEKAGWPAGLFNVVTGNARQIASAMTQHPAVRKISFTGSTATGQALMRQAADQVQKISLELGGNAPFIVFDDADINAAADGAIAAKFRNTGQTCVCVNRFYVQRSVHDAFVEALRARIEQLPMGDGFNPENKLAPLINSQAVEKVREHIEDAKRKGATAYTINRPEPRANFISPTILTGVTQSMLVCQEETFGPLAAVSCFDDEAEAIALANDTPFGLAAYFYSENTHRIWRVADGIEAGMIGINTGLISNAAAPFGGVKASGFGREGAREGIDEYLETKYLLFGRG
ncbi:MAG TPA: NAD-dependent succinate-semialdehyde dehydrogenase [Halothiobacillaceae bacterium]|nr:NAD-dependent succinate-semialdehyde dehydrogenase [Halothiobacillaceae bacterium]